MSKRYWRSKRERSFTPRGFESLLFADFRYRGEVERCDRRLGVGNVSSESSLESVKRESRSCSEVGRDESRHGRKELESLLTFSDKGISERLVAQKLEIECSSITNFVINVIKTSSRRSGSARERETIGTKMLGLTV
jgi:hypothetical protein